MGFVTRIFIKPSKTNPANRLGGSFVLDLDGRVLTSTLSGTIAPSAVKAMGGIILAIFQSAKKAHLCLDELVVQFEDLQLKIWQSRSTTMISLLPNPDVGQSAGSSCPLTFMEIPEDPLSED